MRPSSGKPQTVSCFLFVLTPVPSAALHSCYKTFKVEIDLATAQQNLEVLRQVVRRQSGNAVHTKEVQSVSFQERRTVRHPLFNAHRGRLPGQSGRVFLYSAQKKLGGWLWSKAEPASLIPHLGLCKLNPPMSQAVDRNRRWT